MLDDDLAGTLSPGRHVLDIEAVAFGDRLLTFSSPDLLVSLPATLGWDAGLYLAATTTVARSCSPCCWV